MMLIKYKFVLVVLFGVFYGSKLSVFSHIINKIDYAYETTDSLVFYGDTNTPLKCMLSTELIFKKKSDKSISLEKVNLDRMDIRQISDNKKISFISKYEYSERVYIIDSINKWVYPFLKKQELKIFDRSKEYLKGEHKSIYLKAGLFLWIYIYPYPQNINSIRIKH